MKSSILASVGFLAECAPKRVQVTYCIFEKAKRGSNETESIFADGPLAFHIPGKIYGHVAMGSVITLFDARTDSGSEAMGEQQPRQF